MFKVMIIETLKLTVEVEANDNEEAEQLANEAWYKGKYILDADNFTGVEFEAVAVEEVGTVCVKL